MWLRLLLIIWFLWMSFFFEIEEIWFNIDKILEYVEEVKKFYSIIFFVLILELKIKDDLEQFMIEIKKRVNNVWNKLKSMEKYIEEDEVRLLVDFWIWKFQYFVFFWKFVEVMIKYNEV